MKKMLCVLLTLTALNGMNPSLAAQLPQATVVTDSSTGEGLSYNCLYTESAWQGVALPPEVMMALGDPQKMVLTVGALPGNVTVSLRHSHAAGVVGLKVTRKDKTQAVHQMGTLTLSNPATGYSYAVQVMVDGQERTAK